MQEDGTLVLLDFGQCKALTAHRQRALARLIIALDKGWPSGVVAALKVGSIPCMQWTTSLKLCASIVISKNMLLK